MIRNLVIVSSLTGNTRQIGQALVKAYPDTQLMSTQEAKDNALLDVVENVAVGFWCGHGGMPEDVKALMPQLINKRLGVFATMGGDPQSENAKAWLGEQAAALVGEDRANTLVATFMCRGKIAQPIIEQMKKMPGWATPERLARWQSAATHPDQADEAAAVAAFAGLFD